MDINKPPNPDRWLPRHERSSFKGRKKGKGKDRGAQGAISASHAVKQQEGKGVSKETLEEGKVHNIDKEEQKEFESNRSNTPVAGRRGGRTGGRSRPTQGGRGGQRRKK